MDYKTRQLISLLMIFMCLIIGAYAIYRIIENRNDMITTKNSIIKILEEQSKRKYYRLYLKEDRIEVLDANGYPIYIEMYNKDNPSNLELSLLKDSD